jgi:hypothetical protein
MEARCQHEWRYQWHLIKHNMTIDNRIFVVYSTSNWHWHVDTCYCRWFVCIKWINVTLISIHICIYLLDRWQQINTIHLYRTVRIPYVNSSSCVILNIFVVNIIISIQIVNLCFFIRTMNTAYRYRTYLFIEHVDMIRQSNRNSFVQRFVQRNCPMLN